MSELRECPFCGGEATLHSADMPDGQELSGVYCPSCGAMTAYEGFKTSAEATAAWNRRASWWVSVKEGSPDAGATVLALRSGEDMVLWYNGETWLTPRTNFTASGVTHWAKLPQAPEEDK